MTRRPYDSDVWGPPSPLPGENNAAAATAAPSKFMQHFQNRVALVGKDGTNAQLPAVVVPARGPATPRRGLDDGVFLTEAKSGAEEASRGAAKKQKAKRGILAPDEWRAQQQLQQPQPQLGAPQEEGGVGANPAPPLLGIAGEHITRSAPPQLSVLSLQLRPRPAVRRASSGQRLTPILPPSARSSPSTHDRQDAETPDRILELLEEHRYLNRGGVLAPSNGMYNPQRHTPASQASTPSRAGYPTTGVSLPNLRQRSAATSAGDLSSASGEVVDAASRPSVSPARRRRGSDGGRSSGSRGELSPASWRAPPRATPDVVIERLECLVEPELHTPSWRKKYEPPEEQPLPYETNEKPRRRRSSSRRRQREKGQAKSAAAPPTRGSKPSPRKTGKEKKALVETRSQPPPTAARTRKPVDYTPATVDDYKAMMERYAAQKQARGLGPADTDAQRRARERKERERAYGRAVEQAALERHVSTPPPSDNTTTTAEKVCTDEAGRGQEGNGGHTAAAVVAAAKPPSPRATPHPSSAPTGKMIRQPPSAEVLQARERRLRALSYGKAVEQKQLDQYQQQQEEMRARLAAEGEAALGATEEERAMYRAMDRDLARSPSSNSPTARTEGADGRGKRGRKPQTVAEAQAAERRRRLADLEARHRQHKVAVDVIRKQFASKG